MKTRLIYAIALCCFTALLALAADPPPLEGTWATDGVATFEAAKSAGKSLSNLPEAVTIKFKVDVKKNTVSGSIDQMNAGLKYDVKEGKLTDKTFTFNTVESGNSNSKPLAWKGELQDPNTVVLTPLPVLKEGQAAPKPLVFHRVTKK